LLIAIGSFALYLLVPAGIYHLVGRSIFLPNFSNRRGDLALFPVCPSATLFSSEAECLKNPAGEVSFSYAYKQSTRHFCPVFTEPERMRAGLQRLHTSLLEANIQHVFYESPGTDHEWQTWRRDLKDFAPRLFQQTSQ
jgi:hypothetical protein